MALVKYRYADSNGAVVDIESVGQDRNRDFTCLSCQGALVPVLGQKRQRHFRHKIDVECSKETYLHNLAKRVLCETYQQCLADGSPFTIEYYGPRICNHCAHHGPCTVNPALYRTDLTQIFKKVDMESRVGAFIPDILLVSDKDDKLFIEIAVTHFSEESKTGSGFRIVEIAIESEDDIDLIRRKMLSVLDTRVTMMNFRVKPVTGGFYHECPRETSYFRLHKSGKSIIITGPTWEYDKLLSVGECVEKVDYPTPDVYAEKVREHFEAGRHIMNCLLCRFHCIGYRTGASFCKLKKESIDNLNGATDCNKFKVKSPDKPTPTLPRYSRHRANQLAVLAHTEISIRDSLAKDGTTDFAEISVQASPPDKVTMKFYGRQMSCIRCLQPITFITRITFESERMALFSHNLHDDSLRFYRLSSLKRFLPKELHEDLNVGILVKGRCHSCEKVVVSVLCPHCLAIQCEKMVMGKGDSSPETEVSTGQTILVSDGKIGIMDLLSGKTSPGR